MPQLDVSMLESLIDDAMHGADDDLNKKNLAVVPIDSTQGTPLQKTILRMKVKRLAVRGVNARNAAKALNLNEQTVRKIYQEPDFRAEVFGAINSAFEGVDAAFVEESQNLEELLKFQALESFNALTSMLKEEPLSATQKIKIHQDFLDRAEVSASKKMNINKRLDTTAASNPETLARAAQTAREMDEARKQKLRKQA